MIVQLQPQAELLTEQEIGVEVLGWLQRQLVVEVVGKQQIRLVVEAYHGLGLE